MYACTGKYNIWKEICKWNLQILIAKVNWYKKSRKGCEVVVKKKFTFNDLQFFCILIFMVFLIYFCFETWISINILLMYSLEPEMLNSTVYHSILYLYINKCIYQFGDSKVGRRKTKIFTACISCIRIFVGGKRRRKTSNLWITVIYFV